LQNFKGNFHVHRSLPEIPVMNQTHPIQNSHFVLLIQTFVLSSNQYQAAKVSMTRIYAGRSGVQISAEAIELSILQNIQTSSGTHPASKSIKYRAFLWQ